ncbi:hypothetical protein BGW80DRAFT_1465420 [Lactifluus volemus]|nr:hypothetical protein BGW80DRAFT_1465420 [Lactifluus volemus]
MAVTQAQFQGKSPLLSLPTLASTRMRHYRSNPARPIDSALNTGAFAVFFFWIDGHDMRIIEPDGTDADEHPINLLSVTVAQRYSVLVTARNDAGCNWAIHANRDTTMFPIPFSLVSSLIATLDSG